MSLRSAPVAAIAWQVRQMHGLDDTAYLRIFSDRACIVDHLRAVFICSRLLLLPVSCSATGWIEQGVSLLRTVTVHDVRCPIRREIMQDIPLTNSCCLCSEGAVSLLSPARTGITHVRARHYTCITAPGSKARIHMRSNTEAATSCEHKTSSQLELSGAI